MKKHKVLLMLCVPICVAGYFFYTYVLNAKKQALEALLARFEEAVKRHDPKAIARFLQNDLNHAARITLDITTSTTGFGEYAEVFKQDFTKSEFIRFVDLTLYPLEQYSLQSGIDAFSLIGGTAKVTLRHNATARGNSYVLGFGYPTAYTLTGPCEGEVVFSQHDTPIIQSMDCHLTLAAARDAPKYPEASPAPPAPQDLSGKAENPTPH